MTPLTAAGTLGESLLFILLKFTSINLNSFFKYLYYIYFNLYYIYFLFILYLLLIYIIIIFHSALTLIIFLSDRLDSNEQDLTPKVSNKPICFLPGTLVKQSFRFIHHF